SLRTGLLRLTQKLVRRETGDKGGTKMKPSMLLAAIALLTLAACGQSGGADSAATTAATTADMKAQVEGMDPAMQPVFAWQQLGVHQQTHPEESPGVPKVREAQTDGEIPANVAPNTIYTPLKGQLVFSVQCGQQLTSVGNHPNEHWLVAFAPGAANASV